MNKAAIAIFKQKDFASDSARGSAGGYENAARGVSDITDADFNSGNISGNPQSCNSLLGTFMAFFWGAPVGPANGLEAPSGGNCPIPLGQLLQKYYSAGGDATGAFSPDHYTLDFSWFPAQFASSSVPNQKGMLSAYVPGPFTGVSIDGVFDNLSAASSPELMRRNFYSTKLVALNSLSEGGNYRKDNFTIMSEGDVSNNVEEIKQKNYKNPLQVPTEAQGIKH